MRGHVKRIEKYLSGAPGAPRMPNVLGVLAHHARIAAGLGVSAEKIEALADAMPDAWTPLERLLLDATDRLIDRYAIGDATWAGLETHLDTRQLLEVPFVVGSYLCLAMGFNSAGLEPDPDMRSEMPSRPPESEE